MASRGRVKGNGDRKYEIQGIWDTHHEIMRLALTGMKQADIARMLNVSEAMVTYTMNSTIVKQQMDIMRGARDAESLDVAIEIKNLAPRAVEIFKEALDTAEMKDKISVAKDILDRAGYAAPKVLEGRFVHAHLTGEEIAEIRKRARSSGILATECEYAEVTG